MSDPKYAYPYPPPQGIYVELCYGNFVVTFLFDLVIWGGVDLFAGGYYQGPPVMAPPQYAAPPPKRQPGFLEGCLAALCCCCLLDECCCDPSIIFLT
ncbi:hypothetical protein IC582_000183 [Cucumis melo]